jgi:hypothetical protein
MGISTKSTHATSVGEPRSGATGKVGTISSTTGNSLADSEGRQATVPNRKIGKLQDGYEANFLVWIATRLRTWTT